MAALGDARSALQAEGRSHPVAFDIIRLLALTGARRNEIARLKWEEVDQERSTLRLQDSKTGRKVIPLGAAALSVLVAQPRSNFVYVFPQPGEPDKPFRGLFYAWELARERARLAGVRIHDLRHSFASAGLASGQALPLIGKLLGHAQVTTTARYAHLADDPVKAAAERISDAISSAMDGKTADVRRIARRAKP
jgi:integrase